MLHSVVPGEQTPTQAPPTHADELHSVVVVPHCSFEPHVRYPLLVVLHSFEHAVQTPVHTPLVQRYGHGLPLTHVPVELHVCGVVVLPRHCFAPGTQLPVHAPEVQT